MVCMTPSMPTELEAALAVTAPCVVQLAEPVEDRMLWLPFPETLILPHETRVVQALTSLRVRVERLLVSPYEAVRNERGGWESKHDIYGEAWKVDQAKTAAALQIESLFVGDREPYIKPLLSSLFPCPATVFLEKHPKAIYPNALRELLAQDAPNDVVDAGVPICWKLHNTGDVPMTFRAVAIIRKAK